MRTSLLLATLTLGFASATASGADRKDAPLLVHHFVPHVSTVPVNAGQTVGLYVREKVMPAVARQAESKKGSVPIVLFLHGGFSPSTVAYDLDYKDYSWMDYLARAGFDVFALTHTAYGTSPKPTMDDPCNVDPKQQALLIPHI